MADEQPLGETPGGSGKRAISAVGVKPKIDIDSSRLREVARDVQAVDKAFEQLFKRLDAWTRTGAKQFESAMASATGHLSGGTVAGQNSSAVSARVKEVENRADQYAKRHGGTVLSRTDVGDEGQQQQRTPNGGARGAVVPIDGGRRTMASRVHDGVNWVHGQMRAHPWATGAATVGAIGALGAMSYFNRNRDSFVNTDVQQMNYMMSRPAATFGSAARFLTSDAFARNAGTEDRLATAGLMSNYGYQGQLFTLANQISGVMPGMTLSEGAQTAIGMQSPSTALAARRWGIRTRPGGIAANLPDVSQQMLERIYGGRMPSARELEMFRPGNNLYESLMTMTGGNVEVAQAVRNYGQAAARFRAQGGQGQFDPTNEEHRRAIGMDAGSSLFEKQREQGERISEADIDLWDRHRDSLRMAIERQTDLNTGMRELAGSISFLTGPLAEFSGVIGPLQQAFSIATTVFLGKLAFFNDFGGGKGAPAGGPGGVVAGGGRGGGASGRGGVLGTAGRIGGLAMRGAMGASAAYMGTQITNQVTDGPGWERGLGTAASWAAGGAMIGGPWGAVIGGILGGAWGLSGGMGGSLEDAVAERVVERLIEMSPQDRAEALAAASPEVQAMWTAAQGEQGDATGAAGLIQRTVQEATSHSMPPNLAGGRGVDGLNPEFRRRLSAMFRDRPSLSVTVGFRSYEEQRNLFVDRYTTAGPTSADSQGTMWRGQRWYRKPGAIITAAPGRSKHQAGLAIDVGSNGGTIRGTADAAWVRNNVSRYGLRLPMPSAEPWHIEMEGGDWTPTDGGSGEAGETPGVGGSFGSGMAHAMLLGAPGGSEGALLNAFLSASPTAPGGPLSGSAAGADGGSSAAYGNAPVGRGTLDARQVYKLARSVGFDHQDAITMTAIAWGESGLNTGAHNPDASTGDNSYGLWQINMLGNLGPSRRRQFGLSSNDQLFDPRVNARAAWEISGGGTNFNPWTVYKKGLHLQYMDDVQRQVAEMGDAVHGSGGSVAAPTSGGRGGVAHHHTHHWDVKVNGASADEARRLAEMVMAMIAESEETARMRSA